MSTAVTVQAAPRIACPPWCTVPEAEHVAELPNWEGFVIHTSGTIAEMAGHEITLGTSAFIDGTPDPNDGLTVWLDQRPLTPGEARAAAAELIRAADRIES